MIGVFNGMLFSAASFSESFYGLKRISLSGAAVNGRLSWRQEKLAVILLIAYPYLRAKAEKYKLDEIDGRVPKTASIQFFFGFH